MATVTKFAKRGPRSKAKEPRSRPNIESLERSYIELIFGCWWRLCNAIMAPKPTPCKLSVVCDAACFHVVVLA